MSATRPEDISGEIERQEQFATNQKLVAAQSEDQQHLVPAQLDNQQQLVLSQDENRMQEAVLGTNEPVAVYNITGSPSMGDQIHHHYVPQQNITQHGPQTVYNLYYQQNVTNISPQQSLAAQQQLVLPITSDQQATTSTNSSATTSPSEIAHEVAAAISDLLPTHSSNEQTAEMASGIEQEANQMTLSLKQNYDAEMFVSNDSAPVPLQLTGYEADEIEEFGSKVSASTQRLQLQPTVCNHQFSPDVETCCLNRPSETDQTGGNRTPSQEKYCFELVDNQTFQCKIMSGIYKVGELFTISAKNAFANADRNRINEAAKTAYVEKHGNIVGAIGSAGNGKTTFVKQMVQGIFEDNPDQFPFVFYIPFKSIDFSEKMTVLQFLVRYSLPDWDHSPETDKDLLKLINTSDNVYVITEALDETDVKRFTKTAPVVSLYQSATSDAIIKNLFSGRLLPKAKKLITSRPGAFHDLHPHYKPRFVVKVLGLSEKSQKLLCRQLCTDKKEHEQVQQQLELNPNISVLCYNPMQCKMIVKHLRNNKEEQLDAVSSTTVFASTFDDCIRSEHFKGEPETLLRLTALALRGMKEDKFVFDRDDLDRSDIKCFETFLKLTICGMKDLEMKIVDGDKRFFFVHLLWQEFFAALHLIFFSKLDDFNSLFPHLSEDRWDSVVKFMFGFLNPSVYEKLLTIFSVSSKSDIDVKKNKLKSLIPSSIPDSLDSLFKICSWAVESNDPSIKSQVFSSLSPTITFRGDVFPFYISHFAHILATDQSNPRSISIDIKYPTFHGNGLKNLLDAVNSSVHKVRSISFCRKRIEEDEAYDISQQITSNNIEKIVLCECNPTIKVIQILSDAIQCRTATMKELGLRGNKFSLGLKYLFQCVGKVKKLVLSGSRVSETDMEELAINISQRDQPIKELDLTGMKLGSLGLKHISQCVGKVQKLVLSGCEVSETDIEDLVIKISQRDHPMELLDLQTNALRDVGAEALCKCLHKIRCLRLGDNYITQFGIQAIRSVLTRDDVNCDVERLDEQLP